MHAVTASQHASMQLLLASIHACMQAYMHTCMQSLSASMHACMQSLSASLHACSHCQPTCMHAVSARHGWLITVHSDGSMWTLGDDMTVVNEHRTKMLCWSGTWWTYVAQTHLRICGVGVSNWNSLQMHLFVSENVCTIRRRHIANVSWHIL